MVDPDADQTPFTGRFAGEEDSSALCSEHLGPDRHLFAFLGAPQVVHENSEPDTGHSGGRGGSREVATISNHSARRGLPSTAMSGSG